MRKLEDRTHYAAEMHRLQKAVVLSTLIRTHYGKVTQAMLDVLPSQSHEWWVSLSKAAKVNPPSPATVEAVIGLLAQEIGAYEHPDDVLEGLPTP